MGGNISKQPLSDLTFESGDERIRARKVVGDILNQRGESAKLFEVLPYIQRVFLLTWFMSNITLFITFALPNRVMPEALSAHIQSFFPISTIGVLLLFLLPPFRLFYVYMLLCIGAFITLVIVETSHLAPSYITYFYGYLGLLFFCGAAIFPLFPKAIPVISTLYWIATVLMWITISPHKNETHSSIFLFNALFTASLPSGYVFSRIFNKMLVLAHDQNQRVRELTQVNQLLEISLRQNQIGFLCFDSDGILTLERGLSIRSLFPQSTTTSLTSLHEVLDLFKSHSEGDFTPNSDTANVFKTEDFIITVSRKDFDGSSVITLVDVTELHKFQSQMQRQQTLKTIGELASGIAHSYNNAISVALSQLHTLEKKNKNANLANHITPAIKVLDNSSEFTRKLMGLAGETELKEEVVNIGETLRENHDLLRSAISENISLKIYTEEDLLVESDKKGFETAILNLVLNAKAAIGTNRGVIQITAKAIHTNNAEPRVQVTVRDNGDGIVANIQNRIFDPFFTTKDASGAIGLGLTTVRKFVEDYKGEINVHSQHNETVFTIEFAALSAKRAVEITSAASMANTERKTLKSVAINRLPIPNQGAVLIIDENKQMLQAFDALVSALDMKTYTADNLHKAMSLLLHFEDISTVVLDYHLPDIDGIELGQKIKSIKPHVRLILMSGNLPEDAGVRAKENGFEHILSKPLSVNQVESVLRPKNRIRPVSIH